jgi:hypothetical protein
MPNPERRSECGYHIQLSMGGAHWAFAMDVI